MCFPWEVSCWKIKLAVLAEVKTPNKQKENQDLLLKITILKNNLDVKFFSKSQFQIFIKSKLKVIWHFLDIGLPTKIMMVNVFMIRFIFYIFTYRLKQQIPDIKTSLDIVKHLQSRKVCIIIHYRTEYMNATCICEKTGESECHIWNMLGKTQIKKHTFYC